MRPSLPRSSKLGESSEADARHARADLGARSEPAYVQNGETCDRDPANEVLVSAVSAWEIAIKKAAGKLEAPEDLIDAVDEAGFVRRALGFAEARWLEQLPPHHHDRFDRMLIAHALEERCTIVTKDAQISRYAVETLW